MLIIYAQFWFWIIVTQAKKVSYNSNPFHANFLKGFLALLNFSSFLFLRNDVVSLSGKIIGEIICNTD